jgi:hypothetical protein
VPTIELLNDMQFELLMVRRLKTESSIFEQYLVQ